MPPRGKAKSAPNQHDKRHESGLAAPGKRVAKQRSNGHLNGAPNGKTTQPTPTPLLPSPGHDAAASSHRQVNESVTSAGIGLRDTTTSKDNVEGGQRDRTGSDVSGDELVSCSGQTASNNFDLALHVETQSSTVMAKSSPAGSPIGVVSTILTYYPLRDAISILILLLSLPPTLVLVIQTLFASLTFVPPTAGISLSTLPNVKDMFNASGLGYPALATILLVDLIFYLCWLPFQKPLQNMFLDLSQTVIAISLSGAAASNGTPTSSIITCSAIVCVVHMLRYRSIDLGALDYLRSVMHKLDIGVDLALPSAFSSLFTSPQIEHSWSYTAARTTLGVHIVSQGVTTCIRRSLASANERNNSSTGPTKSDTEAAAGIENLPRNNSESAQNLPLLSTSDGRLPGPSASHRDGKVRDSSSKKKRKQANQVRSQQPLWAAIASTKVTFVKEMEQRDAADDAKDAARMRHDTNTNTTFANVLPTYNDRIWISEVHDTGILFQVELSRSRHEDATDFEDTLNVTAGIDKSKPFYVRVNGAAWSSTRIISSTDRDGPDKRWWVGEIYGLTPLSTYHCEIVAMGSQHVLCSTNLITLPAPTAEQAATAPTQPQHQSLRPASPITTVKQSILQAEARLAEARNRIKKTKRDQRSANAEVKREINVLKGKLESFSGADEKQTRRLQQITQHKEQAEAATADLRQQTDALGDVPAEESADMERKRRDWQSAADVKIAKVKEIESARSGAERELGLLNAEISASGSKHDKLLSRRQQKETELRQVTQRRKAEQSAREIQEFERAKKQQAQESFVNTAISSIDRLKTEYVSLSDKAIAFQQECEILQSIPGASQSTYVGPPTPENAGLSNGVGHSVPNGFAPYFSPGYAAPSQGFRSAYQPAERTRGRSSSMLSQVSGFTENNEDIAFEPRHHQTWPNQSHAMSGASDLRREAEGSGSGSGSGTNGSTASNSPKPDATAKPFVPAAAKFSPLVQPGRKPVHSPVAEYGTIGDGR